MITPLHVDGTRPGVEWVASLPKSYRLSPSEVVVLYALACDSFDGKTSAPGWDNLAAWSHMHRASVVVIVQRLTQPTANRPALLAMDSAGGRRRVVFHMLTQPSSGAGRLEDDQANHPVVLDGSSSNHPAGLDGSGPNHPVSMDGSADQPNHPAGLDGSENPNHPVSMDGWEPNRRANRPANHPVALDAPLPTNPKGAVEEGKYLRRERAREDEHVDLNTGEVLFDDWDEWSGLKPTATTTTTVRPYVRPMKSCAECRYLLDVERIEAGLKLCLRCEERLGALR